MKYMLAGNKMSQRFLSGIELDVSLTPFAVFIKVTSYRTTVTLSVTEQ